MIQIRKDLVFLIIMVLQRCATTLVRLFIPKRMEIMLLKEYLLSMESVYIGIAKFALVMIIIYFYRAELRLDCTNFVGSMQENTFMVVILLFWSVAYPAFLTLPVRSTYIAISYLCLRKSLFLFFEKLLLDTFLDVFLFVYLLFYKISEGKRIDRIIRRRDLRLTFYMVLILIGTSALMTYAHYYREFDNDTAYMVYFLMNFTLLLAFDITRSTMFVYFLFVLGKTIATLSSPPLNF